MESAPVYCGTAWRYAGLLFERRLQYAWTRRTRRRRNAWTRRRHGRPGNGRRNAWRRPYGRPASPAKKKGLRRLLRRPDVYSDIINNRSYRACAVFDILNIRNLRQYIRDIFAAKRKARCMVCSDAAFFGFINFYLKAVDR